jgi:type II secretory pathway component HofQ
MMGSEPKAGAIPAGKPIGMSFEKAQLHDVIRFVGEQCGLNVVMPSSIGGSVTVQLKDVPCDQALEALLESRGLWYEYQPKGRLLRIAPRVELDRELQNRQERARQGFVTDPLPSGPAVDLDFKDGPLRDTLQLLAARADANLILPDGIGGQVTVLLKDAPWAETFATILQSHGLSYRYRDKGRVIRVGPSVELDREDQNARERARMK